MQRDFFVFCESCGERHNVKDVKFLNIEEDMLGRNVMEFECPETASDVKSLVFGR